MGIEKWRDIRDLLFSHFFLREFEPMTSASNYSSLLSDENINWFFGVGRD